MTVTMLAAVPVLPVRDIAAAIACYRDKLGFAVRHEAPDYAILTRDSIQVHLWAATDERWKTRNGRTEANPEAGSAMSPVTSGAESFLAGTASCRIEVRGIDTLYETCKAQHVLHNPATRIEEMPWGTREFTAVDQDRNALTFYERT